ncbi:MAG: zinc-binding dehydrogenase, partial [Promethearchaeota archaeon]
VGGSRSALFQAFVIGPLISRMGKKKLGVNPLNLDPMEDYRLLAELFEAGKVKPVIDRVCPLIEVPEALRHLEEGLVLGKVVVTIE